jgi:hypothetical protein
LPTATHDLADEHCRPERPPYDPGVGLGTTDQEVPSQDSTKVLLASSPTATHEMADTQNTLLKAPCLGVRVGPGAIDQEVPSQDSIKV